MLGHAALSEVAPGSLPSAATVTGVGAVTLELFAEAVATFTAPSSEVTGTGAATLSPTAAATAAHGVSGAGAATITLTAAAPAAHGVAGQGAATLTLTAAAVGAHGVSGAGVGSISITGAAVGQHIRFEVRGEVRDSGILVNRRVRVYSRQTGALIGEKDTTAGRFSVHTGFAPTEHYLVPVDLSDAATDWVPPVANRVVSVLAQDV